MGEEGSDKVMVLGTFVEDGGIVRGVNHINEQSF